MVLKSPDHFSSHSQTCDDGCLENGHTCLRKSEVQFRAGLIALFAVSRPLVQVWMKSRDSLGVNFLPSDKDTNVCSLPFASLFDILIVAVSRYISLLTQQLTQEECNLN